MVTDILFGRNSIPDMEKALDAYSMRQKIIANNIANVNTPCFKAKRVAFEEEYAKHLKKASISSENTNSSHIPLGMRTLDKVTPRVEDAATSMNDSGINNVDIDKEMAELAKNNMRYEMTINLLKKRFKNLQSSIKGR